ncbi:NrdG protein [Pasteurella multocida subsp. multocida str. Anand1_cattle]|nr:NrdG protein [Pasteurella multocida subsp. multocida str. Anand1_cattle]
MQIQEIFEPEYAIVEIFESLQGEGFNTGMPSIFVRFGKCNLACPWCDTPYNQYTTWTLSKIVQKVRSFSAKILLSLAVNLLSCPKLACYLMR